MCARRLTNYIVDEINLREKAFGLLAAGRNVVNDSGVRFPEHRNVQRVKRQ